MSGKRGLSGTKATIGERAAAAPRGIRHSMSITPGALHLRHYSGFVQSRFHPE
ncbi:MAG: hypothetical protein J5I81_08135 [Nitrococcus mobilis]|nr:hypothetical protein [Nitrococcus mobilis]